MGVRFKVFKRKLLAGPKESFPLVLSVLDSICRDHLWYIAVRILKSLIIFTSIRAAGRPGQRKAACFIEP